MLRDHKTRLLAELEALGKRTGEPVVGD